jgi:hypothetical protein
MMALPVESLTRQSHRVRPRLESTTSNIQYGYVHHLKWFHPVSPERAKIFATGNLISDGFAAVSDPGSNQFASGIRRSLFLVAAAFVRP